MLAMQLDAIGKPLKPVNIPIPNAQDHEILLKVNACGICRTDLHVVDGDLTEAKLPIIPGHQIIATVCKLGNKVTGFKPGDRVGVPWLGGSCGHCEYCEHGEENLCDHARYTGYQINGGFAEYCVANASYCFAIPQDYPDLQAAPLLCAGLIGYRAYRKIGRAKKIGLYGFGAAAHILIQVAKYHQQSVYAFTRSRDQAAQDFALTLGAEFAGDSEQLPPVELDAAIIFAPVGALVPTALRAVRKGGVVVCAGIHMSDIPAFPYDILWGERSICSVANLTREDGKAFLTLAPKIPVKTEVHAYPLLEANQALDDLRQGQFTGAAVLTV